MEEQVLVLNPKAILINFVNVLIECQKQSNFIKSNQLKHAFILRLNLTKQFFKSITDQYN